MIFTDFISMNMIYLFICLFIFGKGLYYCWWPYQLCKFNFGLSEKKARDCACRKVQVRKSCYTITEKHKDLSICPTCASAMIFSSCIPNLTMKMIFIVMWEARGFGSSYSRNTGILGILLLFINSHCLLHLTPTSWLGLLVFSRLTQLKQWSDQIKIKLAVLYHRVQK